MQEETEASASTPEAIQTPELPPLPPKRRTTGKLLGRDLPQTPTGMTKRPWGRGMRAVDALLPREHWPEFDRLLANPRTTNKSARAWLAGHSVKVSLGAVSRYRNTFDRDTAALREAARTAAWVVQTAEEGKGEQMSSAALSMIEQFVMQSLMRPARSGSNDSGGAHPDAKLLTEAVKILSTAINARQKLLTVTRRLERIRSAGKKTKATPQDVARRMREMLGV